MSGFSLSKDNNLFVGAASIHEKKFNALDHLKLSSVNSSDSYTKDCNLCVDVN